MIDSCYILYQAKKRAFIEYLGQKCADCGKNLLDNPHQADFHHKDANEKEKNPSDLNVLTFQKALIELDKCELLCCMCHKERHFNRDRYNIHKDQITTKSHLILENKIDGSTKTNEDDVLRLYHKGYPIRKIAKELGYSRGPVKRIIAKHGLNVNVYKHPIKISKEQIENLAAQGMNKKEMAQELDCSYATIHNMFNRYNLR